MLFDRVYRLQIGKVGQSKGLEIENLRINFSIQKTASKNPNNCKIKIYNLRATTRKTIETPGTRCILYAGYKEDVGAMLIFSGAVLYAWTRFDGPNVITELDLGDGTQELRDTTISVGYGKNVKSKQVLGDVAKKMGLPLTLAGNAPERTWKNGLSYYGSARTLLDKACVGTGLEWSVQNGNLQVLEKGMVTTRQGIEISSSSGMIGGPESEREEKSEANGKKSSGGESKGKQQDPTKYWNGWKVKTLLMPMLNPGDRVSLKSKSVEGVFRIEELTHTGDSHEGDWQTELKLVDTAKPIGDKKATAAQKGGPAPPKERPLPIPPIPPPLPKPFNDGFLA